jgi:hypothetical protein
MIVPSSAVRAHVVSKAKYLVTGIIVLSYLTASLTEIVIVDGN